ncbi:tyrosine-type recombinase/integrase [Sphingobium chlorophenolicum]|uniref:Phage integrase family protein n=1 Tax=Sphingobium chlorophenolicum TaxID=46429 RepID=A0A081RAD2_SPHCR|nr:tyrosine-type recombinase/integrase [Sphingobium chlorophenolicum]KEQ52155.1 Phage integrase family protein [Sphingobium chlorophenolicum]
MRVLLKGVYSHKKRLADGRVVTYFTLRGYGAIKPLPGDEDEPFTKGSPAFMRAYHAAIDAPRKARVAGTLQSLIDGYQRSSSFTTLSPRTKGDYLKHIAKIEAARLMTNGPPFSSYPLEAVNDPKIRRRLLDWRDKMGERSARQADATFGVLRIILEWGRDRGLLAHNHATRPKKLYRANRSEKLWLPEHIASFRAVAPPSILLAFELALATGQRKGDLLKLGWSSYDGERLRFRQGKRNRLIDMRVTAHLRKILDAERKQAKCATILSHNGKPWVINKEGQPIHFDHLWRKAILAAGLNGLHMHDLRGTACTKLAEAQCTASEIAAMLGWTVTTVNQMLDVYQAMTAALSNSAVAKLEAKKA